MSTLVVTMKLPAWHTDKVSAITFCGSCSTALRSEYQQIQQTECSGVWFFSYFGLKHVITKGSHPGIRLQHIPTTLYTQNRTVSGKKKHVWDACPSRRTLGVLSEGQWGQISVSWSGTFAQTTHQPPSWAAEWHSGSVLGPRPRGRWIKTIHWWSHFLGQLCDAMSSWIYMNHKVVGSTPGPCKSHIKVPLDKKRTASSSTIIWPNNLNCNQKVLLYSTHIHEQALINTHLFL